MVTSDFKNELASALTEYAHLILDKSLPYSHQDSECQFNLTASGAIMSKILDGKYCAEDYTKLLQQQLDSGNYVSIVQTSKSYVECSLRDIYVICERISKDYGCDISTPQSAVALFHLAVCAFVNGDTYINAPIDSISESCIKRLARDPYAAIAHCLCWYRRTSNIRYIVVAHEILSRNPRTRLTWRPASSSFRKTYLNILSLSLETNSEIFPGEMHDWLRDLIATSGEDAALRKLVDIAACAVSSTMTQENRYAAFQKAWNAVVGSQYQFQCSAPNDQNDPYSLLVLLMTYPHVERLNAIEHYFTDRGYPCSYQSRRSKKEFLAYIGSVFSLDDARSAVATVLQINEGAFDDCYVNDRLGKNVVFE